jgi:asparagine synthase (glutamine-hydrolysing)
MSGIIGIFNLDGQPLARPELESMAESLSHRGGDGTSIWLNQGVGLGNVRLCSTPESLGERQPLVSQATGCVITADARIDNRDELSPLLGLGDWRRADLSDSAVILAAYERWGADCGERLLGDFAFAIWDARKQSLFCCRDHFGIKPFYYYAGEGLFAFASEMKALARLPQVPRRINEQMLAEHLSGAYSSQQTTYYQDIFRLPPGHSLRVGRGPVQATRYYSLDPHREIRLGSDQEYAEAFREIFSDAVSCRLRSAFPVGSTLSGGLDSSSITVMASRLMGQAGNSRLRTFSAIFPEVSACDEREFINPVLAENELEPHYVEGDRIGPLSDWQRLLWHQDKPVFAPSLFLGWGLYRAAKEQGVRVLLEGFDGDSVVSHGYHYLQELAHRRRWLALTVETVALARKTGDSWGKPLLSYLQYFGLNPLLKDSRLLRGGRRIWQTARGGVAGQAQTPAPEPEWSSFLNPDFIRRMGLTEHMKNWRKRQPAAARSEREGHYRILTQDNMPLAMEIIDAAAAAFSIEVRYPFWDRRLVEFCLALPPEQKLHRGFSRMVMRRAMHGLLPKKVQRRPGKTDFWPAFRHGLLAFERPQLDQVVEHCLENLTAYFNVAALRQFYQRLQAGEATISSKDLLAFWRVISLALWLQYAWPAQKIHKEVVNM